jgi:hypothetical protein
VYADRWARCRRSRHRITYLECNAHEPIRRGKRRGPHPGQFDADHLGVKCRLKENLWMRASYWTWRLPS